MRTGLAGLDEECRPMNRMRFRLSNLLMAVLVIAIGIAIYRKATSQWLSPKIRGYMTQTAHVPAGYPFVREVRMISDPVLHRPRIIVLNLVTHPLEEQYSPWPTWFDFDWTRDRTELQCFVEGKRVYAEDSVLIFGAIDQGRPEMHRVAYGDFSKLDLNSPDLMWAQFATMGDHGDVPE